MYAWLLVSPLKVGGGRLFVSLLNVQCSVYSLHLLNDQFQLHYLFGQIILEKMLSLVGL